MREGRRWQMVRQSPRSPSRLCIRDERICCFGDALSTIFLLACFCALLPTFRFSSLIFFRYRGMCIFVSLRQCSNHLLLSASAYCIVRALSACVICTLLHLGIPLFFYSFGVLFVALIPRVAFFFFKQKTAYEIMPSLVGSEMCIRDRYYTIRTC